MREAGTEILCLQVSSSMYNGISQPVLSTSAPKGVSGRYQHRQLLRHRHHLCESASLLIYSSSRWSVWADINIVSYPVTVTNLFVNLHILLIYSSGRSVWAISTSSVTPSPSLSIFITVTDLLNCSVSV